MLGSTSEKSDRRSSGIQQSGTKMGSNDEPATLESILKRPENKFCADCMAQGPRWAAINHGVFLCIDCSGIHRYFGTHISKIKSVTLDKWSRDWVESMDKIGNKIANDYYEANLPPGFSRPVRPSNPGMFQDFLRDKYDRRLFVPKGSLLSPYEFFRDGKDPGLASKQSVENASAKSKSTSTVDREPQAVMAPQHHAKKANVFDQLDDIFLAEESSHKKSPTPKTSSALGFSLSPPSVAHVGAAKLTAAKEDLSMLFANPAELGFGTSSYSTMKPDMARTAPRTHSMGSLPVDPWGDYQWSSFGDSVAPTGVVRGSDKNIGENKNVQINYTNSVDDNSKKFRGIDFGNDQLIGFGVSDLLTPKPTTSENDFDSFFEQQMQNL